VSIGGLLLAFGAFFLGMSVRKKSKTTHDTETGSHGGKPELDGKIVFSEKATPPELDSTQRTSMPTYAMEADARHIVPGNELPAQPAPIYTYAHKELSAEPSHAEIDSAQRHELHDQHVTGHELHSEHVAGPSPVSPISSDSRDADLDRSDTYDDPRLMQNPWVQDDSHTRR